MSSIKKLILRISGIFFFIASLSLAVEAVSRTIESYAFFVSSSDVLWGLFYLFTALLFFSFFIFSLFSSGLAAIFAGSGGYIQAVFNCCVYALFCAGLFATLQILTGVAEEEQQILLFSVIGIVFLLVYVAILFFCFNGTETFSAKHILSRDANSLLCLKVYALMAIIVQVGCFLYANKMLAE